MEHRPNGTKIDRNRPLLTKIDKINLNKLIQSFSLHLKILLFQGLLTSDATKSMAKKIHAQDWIECSAKTRENIDELFKLAGKYAKAYYKQTSGKKGGQSCCTLL